jgi:phage portal protein BeeE
MLPIFKRFEDNINAQLLTPKQRQTGLYFEHKIDGLLRGDAKSRAEAYAAGRQWGWLSVNDIRRLENMPAIENGDIYLQPVNMVEAGQPQQQADAYNRLVDDIANMIAERR